MSRVRYIKLIKRSGILRYAFYIIGNKWSFSIELSSNNWSNEIEEVDNA